MDFKIPFRKYIPFLKEKEVKEESVPVEENPYANLDKQWEEFVKKFHDNVKEEK